RGIANYIITTDTFLPLVQAQAKARKIEAHVIVVKHPIGGLNAEELLERIDAAANGLQAAIAV
ncbi:MAG: hypothetical protein H8E30_09745, partial [Alphaproteobacteria bacterium]|nr:hypothetical protein [Alphaproteobacteria bacterium]